MVVLACMFGVQLIKCVGHFGKCAEPRIIRLLFFFLRRVNTEREKEEREKGKKI